MHPVDAAPEPGYVPSKTLADFVRCRDLTCRWPGCDQPAVNCDVDHTIPYADGGRTHASNLKCYCRTHHLVKTFWGWQEKQLPDATLILTSPAGHTYVTTPGSALLFPSLCQGVGALPAAEADAAPDYCAERTAMMPRGAAPAPRTAPPASPPSAGTTAMHAWPGGPKARAWPKAARGPAPPRRLRRPNRHHDPPPF